MTPTCYRCKNEYRSGGCGCPDGITLYHGDCLDVLPGLEPGSVDVIYADPPYGIALRLGEMKGSSGTRKLQFDWDTPVVVDDVRSGLTSAFRVAHSRAGCFVWVGFDTAERYVEPARRAGFTVKPAAWVKKCPPPAGKGNWWPSGFELAYYGYRTGANFSDDDTKRCNVWVADSYRHGQPGKVNHPTQKPLQLVGRHLAALTPPAGIVLDPFAGSGTTLVAAKTLGLRAIGIELEEEYCEIAADRLRQGTLFSQ